MEHFPTRELFRERLAELWHGPTVVTRGRLLEPATLPGFSCGQGLATYRVEGKECELVTQQTREGQGVGSTLLAAVEQKARQEGCTRIWLITTVSFRQANLEKVLSPARYWTLEIEYVLHGPGPPVC